MEVQIGTALSSKDACMYGEDLLVSNGILPSPIFHLSLTLRDCITVLFFSETLHFL